MSGSAKSTITDGMIANGPLKGGKTMTTEGGTRVPARAYRNPIHALRRGRPHTQCLFLQTRRDNALGVLIMRRECGAPSLDRQVPAFWYYPKLLQPRWSDMLGHITDLHPTFVLPRRA